MTPFRYNVLWVLLAMAIGDLIQAIGKSTLTKVTLREMMMHVTDINQFKGVCNIEALRMVYDVEVPAGNQQAFDCFLNGQRVQVKGYNLKSGKARFSHIVNGIDSRQYSSEDPIDAFVVSCIIVCQARFFLLYTFFSKDTKRIEPGSEPLLNESLPTFVRCPPGKIREPTSRHNQL